MRLVRFARPIAGAVVVVTSFAWNASAETYFRYSAADGRPWFNPKPTDHVKCFEFNGNRVYMKDSTPTCVEPFWAVSPPSRNTAGSYLVYPWITGRRPGNQVLTVKAATYTQFGDLYSGGDMISVPQGSTGFDTPATTSNQGLTVPAYGTFTVFGAFQGAVAAPYVEWHGVAYNYAP